MQYETTYNLNLGESLKSRNGQHLMVSGIVETHEFYTTYEMVELSKWWLIRKIQIWTLKKTFKC